MSSIIDLFALHQFLNSYCLQCKYVSPFKETLFLQFSLYMNPGWWKMISKLPTRERMTVYAFHYKRVVLFYKMKRLLCVLYPYTGGGRHTITIGIFYPVSKFLKYNIMLIQNFQSWWNIMVFCYWLFSSYAMVVSIIIIYSVRLISKYLLIFSFNGKYL